MQLKHVLTATTAAVVLTVAGLAQAQQSAPRDGAMQPGIQSPNVAPGGAASNAARGTLHEIKDDKAMATGIGMNAKDLGDTDIYGADGKKIGEVNKVLADSSNQIKAVTIDVGGFLGMGAREVVFPLDKLTKGSEAKRLQTALTKAEIEKLDEWADATPAPRTSAPAR
jgi:hypothetical protein